MICKNCEQNFEGNFCNNCGQSNHIKRINANYILSEISLLFLQFERGLLFTIKELFVQPGSTIRSYLEGKRRYYYKPLPYLFITAGLYVFITYLLGRNTFIGDLVAGFTHALNDNSKTTNTSSFKWILDYQTYIIFFSIPFYSIASYLTFRKAKLNYFEHFILNSFITGHQMIIYLVFTLFIYDDNSPLIILPITAGILFNFWAYIKLFNDRKVLINILLTILTYFLYLIQIFTFVSISAIAAA